MSERRARTLTGEALWAYALKLLAGRAHSIGELRDKMRRRAAEPEEVDGMLARLKELGYLDDRRFAEGFAAARLNTERLGRVRVVRDLRQRRVAPALAESTVANVYRDVNEAELIEEWIRRKYRMASREGLFQEDKELAGAYRRLVRAGFRSGEILRVLKRFAKNPELLDAFEPAEDETE